MKQNLNYKTKKVCVIIISGIFLSSNLIASGIPVVDGTAIEQNKQNFLMEWKQTIKDYTEKVKVWGEEAGHRAQELKKWADEKVQWANDLYTKTGIRDIVNFTKEMNELYNETYETGKTIYTEATGFGLDNFDERAWGLFLKFGGNDVCSNLENKNHQNICKKNTTNAFKEFEVVNKQFQRLKREMDDLNKLSKEVARNKGKQEDLKSSLDTANQIALLRARQENNWRAYQRDLNQLENEKKRLEEAQFQIDRQMQNEWKPF
jgi:virB5 protein